MIRSMTGYGRADLERDGWRCGVEIRAVNGRFLDVRLRLPSGFGKLEENYKRLIREHCERGKIECTVLLAPTESEAGGFSVNRETASRYRALIRELQDTLDVQLNVSFMDLLNNKQLVGSPDWNSGDEAIETLIGDTVSEALRGLSAMRDHEGKALQEDMTERVLALRGMLDELIPLTQNLPALYAQKLREKLVLLSGDGPLPAEDRILQEIAIYADRCDVSEEITRFRAHLDHLLHLFEERGALGRKIEFLLQEVNREANTLSVKSNSAPVSERVVDIKAELEKLREQIQNIE